MKHLIYCLLAGTISCFPGKIFSQEVLSSCGGSAHSSTGTISYTLGELVISTGTGSTRTITQGFHQSRTTITATLETAGSTFSIIAFPNPTSGIITLKPTGELPNNLEYKVIDAEGIIRMNGKLTDGQTGIFLDQLSAAVYFIKIVRNGKDIKTFRVVKQ